MIPDIESLDIDFKTESSARPCLYLTVKSRVMPWKPAALRQLVIAASALARLGLWVRADFTDTGVISYFTADVADEGHFWLYLPDQIAVYATGRELNLHLNRLSRTRASASRQRRRAA